MKTHLRVCLVVALFATALSGCASYTLKPYSPGPEWPPGRGTSASVIGVRVYGETFLNDTRQGTNLRDLRLWQEQAAKAYAESGLFAEVKSGSMEVDTKTGAFVDPEAGIGHVDLRADIEIVDKQRVSWTMSVVTGLTLYIVPSKITSDFTVKTTIRDNGGKVLGEFTTTDSVLTWQQIFLVFVMPFSYPRSVEEQAIFDLNRAALIEMSNKRILVPKPAKKP